MIVVLPFCGKDAAAMERLVQWMIELDGKAPFNVLLSFDETTPAGAIAGVRSVAEKYFKLVSTHCYSPPPVMGWPAAPNWAWQRTACHIFEQYKEPWFWIEADAIPTRPGWLTKIHDEFKKANKLFGGHVVESMGHMNGVGIYPWNVIALNQRAMLARAAAWDVVLKETITGNVVPLNDWMQHCWNIHPQQGYIWNGDGQPVSFRSQEDLRRWLDFNCYIFHRCKDGSLIEQLRIWKARELEEQIAKTVAIETNVPQFVTQVAQLPTDVAVDGPVEIFIVTYAKDREWLDYCIRGLKTFCSGFAGITVAIPSQDAEKFTLDPDIRVVLFEERRKKGMLHHMVIMASADQYVPAGTAYVMHIDSDCIYQTPTTPADYFIGGKPVYLKRTYDSLKDDKGVISDCHQWLAPTSRQLGFPVKWYTMCRHPTILPVGFYEKYRAHIESVQKWGFTEYMLCGKNSFPQDRMDWTAMGAYAHEFFNDRFHWINIGKEAAPADRQKTFWSHGGVATYKADLDAIFGATPRYIPTEEDAERMAQ